jgi:hypothetical protein
LYFWLTYFLGAGFQRDARRKAKATAIVLEVIEKDFHVDFTEAWATTVALTETIPDQANNEIRNAFNHLARALKSETEEDAAGNIREARSHLDRAKRDCLKISVIYVHESVQSLIWYVEHNHGLVPENIRIRRKTLTIERKSIYSDETMGLAVSDRLEALLREYADLESHIIDNFGLPSRLVTGMRIFFRKWWKTCVIFVAATLAAFTGAFIFVLVFPDNKDVHIFIEKLLSYL